MGVVLGASRRHVWIRCADGSNRLGRSSRRALEVVVGDTVRYHLQGDEAVIDEAHERRNLLMRCSARQTKRIVANVDLLLVVTAVKPLFNTAFVDRIIAAATEQRIPVLIVVNKDDLGTAETLSEIEIYKKLGYRICYTSAKNLSGLEQLRERLADPTIQLVALAGVSGVGKSSLLNALIPETDRKTAAVSERTGQGRQTTSQAYAYDYPVTKERSILLVDLPGLQNFGLQHLDRRSIAATFLEFERFAGSCQYSDCRHIAEPGCAVRLALSDGEIAASRYQSYLDLLAEIDAARSY